MLDFRFATTDDVAALHLLVESAYRGEVSEQGWTSETHLLGGQRIDDEMLLDLLSKDGASVLLASRDGQLVACCEIQAPGGHSAAHEAAGGAAAVDPRAGAVDDPAIAPPSGHAAAAYFGMFAVDPTIQNGGIGREVLAEAERIAAAELGATVMEMTVIEQRESLVAWYERRGYTRTGEIRPFPYGDERFGLPKVDDLRMVVLTKPLG